MLQIDAMITRTATDKGAGAGTGGGEAQQVATDNLSAGLTLQGQLNEAIEKEDYALAALLRDRLNTMKVRWSLASPGNSPVITCLCSWWHLNVAPGVTCT